VFYTDVAKVDRNVACVAMVVYVCCKSLSPMFHLLFADVCYKRVYLDVAYVSHIRCKHFYLDVAFVCNGFQVFLGVFASVLEACFKCFICLQIHVASIASVCFKGRSDIVHAMRVGTRRGHECAAWSMLGWRGPRVGAQTQHGWGHAGTDTECRRMRTGNELHGLRYRLWVVSDGRPGASSFLIKKIKLGIGSLF
jgi:hypothetical protein